MWSPWTEGGTTGVLTGRRCEDTGSTNGERCGSDVPASRGTPRAAAATRCQERAGVDSSSEPLGGLRLPTRWFWVSSPQNCERMIFVATQHWFVGVCYGGPGRSDTGPPEARATAHNVVDFFLLFFFLKFLLVFF